MKKVNLEIIYKKVKQRIKRSTGDQYDLAVEAKDAARVIMLNPTLKSVNSFRKIENLWLHHASSRSVTLANEFETAIRQGNFIAGRVYNSSKTGFKPAFGYLYCFSSNDYPGIVKIGSTTYEIQNRLLTYKSRHKLDHLEVLHSIFTADPATKEEAIHALLRSFQIYPETILKSNEWFQISKRRAINVIKQFGQVIY